MPNYPDFLLVTNFASCTSTNDYVKENCPRLRHCLPLMVNADEQSSGRGRNNRVWHSPAGLGLYATFAFAWPQRETLKFLSLLAGVAVISVLEEICNQPFCLKWPNDVLQGRKKICGILTETLLQADETVCLIGIGINVNHGTGDFPGELSARATSLRLITGREYSVADIRVRLAFAFFFWLERLKKNGGIEIVIQADKHSRPLLGQALAVHVGRRTVRGKFVGLDSTGGLILENSAGSREIFASGEILLE